MQLSRLCAFVYRAAAVAVLLIFPGYALAQSEEPPEFYDQERPAIFFDSLSTDTGDIEPYLYNGQLVTGEFMRQHWPATVRSVFQGTDGRFYNCTSSFVGPKVALTAAHCVGRFKAANFLLQGRPFAATCEMPTAYPGNKRMDVALCFFQQPVPVPRFETIALAAASALRVNDPILLTGFGCQDLAMQRSSGQFKIGKATVHQASSAADTDLLIEGDLMPGGRAVLCPGDSGGGAYKLGTGSVETDRLLIGVNSRTLVRSGQLAGTSYIVPTYAGPVAEFISSALRSRGLADMVCIAGNDNDQVDCL